MAAMRREESGALGGGRKGNAGMVASGAVLTGFGLALLPIWDGMDRYGMLRALSGSGLGSSGAGPSIPLSTLMFAAAGVSVAVALIRRPGRRVIFWAAALVGGAYLINSGMETALRRSAAVNYWPVCEEWKPTETQRWLMEHAPRAPSFDGPHLPTGDPCNPAAEKRSIHDKESVPDGIIQIMKRFPKDRLRIFGGSLSVVVAFVAGGLLLWRGAPIEAAPGAGEGARSEDEGGERGESADAKGQRQRRRRGKRASRAR